MARDVAAIVPAAGAGRRFGTATRKPFVRLRGAPLLAHTLRALQDAPDIGWIIVVVRAGDEQPVEQLLARGRISKALAPCRGGASRAESVAKGLACVPPQARWVLVHDGARPCVSGRLIHEVVRAAKRWGAVACGLPASVTVKAADAAGRVQRTIPRETLWLIQTPQVFRRDWFAAALARTNGRLAQFPDDAAIVEAAGFPVRVVPGDPLNMKVTTQDDALLAGAILARRGRAR